MNSDPKVSFYLEHRELIEEWASLRDVAARELSSALDVPAAQSSCQVTAPLSFWVPTIRVAEHCSSRRPGSPSHRAMSSSSGSRRNCVSQVTRLSGLSSVSW